jgi:kinesin family protein C2/C3
MGPPDNAELAGVNRRAITDLFQMCKERTDFTYTFTINMVEVYNDQIFDLLVGHHVEPLKLKQLPDGKTVLDGVTIRSVHKPEDVAAVLAEADVNRSVAATAMNMHSSRSHLILQVCGHSVMLERCMLCTLFF